MTGVTDAGTQPGPMVHLHYSAGGRRSLGSGHTLSLLSRPMPLFMKSPHAVRASLLMAMPWFCSQAMALPALNEPVLQPLMAAVSTEFQQHAAQPAALAAPKDTPAWPCAVSEAELDVFASTVDSDKDPVAKAELLNDARSSGIPPSRITYTNKVVTPVRAQCEAGKLSGPLEFWVEYDQTVASSMLTLKYHNLVRVRATARAGQPEGSVLVTGTTLSQQTEYADRATADMMAAQPKPRISTVFFMAFTAPGSAPKASVATARTTVDGTLTVSTRTRFSRPDGQVIEDGYGVFGGPAHHDSRTLRRNGKLHGPQQTFAGMMGTFPIPASTVCWQDGEKVLTNSCPAD